MSNVYKINDTGSAAINVVGTVPAGPHYRLVGVTCNFSAAPTTSESFTITLDAKAGAAYDTLLYTINPSLLSTTDILWQPDEEIILEPDDAIDVAYANTDANVYGVQITFKAV
jgi:hypothetical protein